MKETILHTTTSTTQPTGHLLCTSKGGAEGKSSIYDTILSELKSGNYDLVLLPKHDKTHAQEFLFGDAAVQLRRKAHVPPVLSVKGSNRLEAE